MGYGSFGRHALEHLNAGNVEFESARSALIGARLAGDSHG